MRALTRLVAGLALLLSVSSWRGAEASSEAMTMTNTWETPTIVIPAAVRSQLDRQPLDTPEKISSPYGPRWKVSQNRYDFHPGIDFWHADNVTIFAIGAGEIYRVYNEGDSRFSGGGNVVSIKHTLVEPIVFHKKTISVLYSLYLHMSEFAVGIVEGGTVTKGQVLGKMGQSGDTVFTHLHFETRLGTQCSFPYQMANPSTTGCATNQFEPKINPFFFIPKLNHSLDGTSNLTKEIVSITRDVSRSTITFFVPTRAMLQLNRIQFGSVDLDFSLYTGFNASHLDTLDAFHETLTWGRLWPGYFISTSETYNMTLEFYDPTMVSATTSTTITFTDIWGNAVVASMPGLSSDPTAGTTTTAAGTTTAAASSTSTSPTEADPAALFAGAASTSTAMCMVILCMLLATAI